LLIEEAKKVQLENAGWELSLNITQMFVSIMVLWATVGGITLVLWKLGVIKSFDFLPRLIAGIALGALIFSAACAAYYITAGGTIYDAAYSDAKWASYSIFFGLLDSSQYYLYNKELAEGVEL